MATVSIQFSGAQTVTNSKTVSDADVLRLINAEKTIRNLPGATNAQILNLVCADIFAWLKMRAREGERLAAEASVTEITMT